MSPTSTLGRFFDLSLDMLAVADMDGTFTMLNRSWERTLGWSAEELTSRPFLDFVHPDDREATLAESSRLAAGEDTVLFENRYRCKDGSFRTLLWSATPVPAADAIYAVARDISDRKAAEVELRGAKERAEAADREKGLLLSRMSHELRTPLNAILGFGQLLEVDELTAEQCESVQEILRAGRHLLGLVDEVLGLPREPVL